jgi:hypothetical protein
MRKALFVADLVALAVFALAPLASAPQVTPPGKGAPACTTSVHAGDPTNPAHTGGMLVADAHSDAITPGACP